MAVNYSSSSTGKGNSLEASKFSSLQNSSNKSNPTFGQRNVQESECQSLPTYSEKSHKEGVASFRLAHRKVESLGLYSQTEECFILVADVNRTMLKGKHYSRLASLIADGTMDRAKYDQLISNESLVKNAKKTMAEGNLKDTKINQITTIAYLLNMQSKRYSSN